MRCGQGTHRSLALASLLGALHVPSPLAASSEEAPRRISYGGISAVELTGREEGAGEGDGPDAQADASQRTACRESIRIEAAGVSDFPWRLRLRERVDKSTGETHIRAKAQVSAARQLPSPARGYGEEGSEASAAQVSDFVQDFWRWLLADEAQPRAAHEPQAARPAEQQPSGREAERTLGRQAREVVSEGSRQVHVFVEDGSSGRHGKGSKKAAKKAKEEAKKAKKAKGSEEASRRRRKAPPAEPAALEPEASQAPSSAQQQRCSPRRARGRRGAGSGSRPGWQVPPGFWVGLSFAIGGLATKVAEVRRRRRRSRSFEAAASAGSSVTIASPLQAPHLGEFDEYSKLEDVEKDKLERFDFELRKLIAQMKDTNLEEDRMLAA